MPDQIVIEGGLVRHVRQDVISETTLEAMTAHLVRRISTTFPVMPAHPVRYMRFDAETNQGIWLVETAPAIRHLRMLHVEGDHPDAPRHTDGDVGVWQVQYPWQYFAFGFGVNIQGNGVMADFTINRTDLYWAREQLRGPDHPLIVAPVPNVDTNGRICWGNTRPDNSSLSARIDDYINSFFSTTFNEHLGHRTPFDESLDAWENATDRLEPGSYMNWAIWDTATTTTPDQLDTRADIGQIPTAQLAPSYSAIPQPPENFTIARAREYLARLSPQARLRFSAALAAITEAVPEEATA